MRRLKTDGATTQEKRRYYREKYRANRVLKEKPLERTGDERITPWRLKRGLNGDFVCTVHDAYHDPVFNQTRFDYIPPDAKKKTNGVFNFQIVLQDFTEEKFLVLIKRHLSFKRHIIASREINGTDRRIYDFHCALDYRPSEAEVREIYRDFALS